jgi:myo-inositol-1(or 4)-monophosphatase
MDFQTVCDLIAHAVADAISPLIGTPDAGRNIRMGADGTPTKYIDLVAEECVIGHLVRYPLCRTLISEEAGKVTMEGEDGTIFLDPLDGTYNAVAGIPFYALSIAYAEEGIVKDAFVRNLAGTETFTATAGKGAFMDGEPVFVSKITSLDESALSVYGRKFDPGRAMQLGQKIRRWRLLGASALELSYVGCGRIDGFIDLRGTLRVTDAAAGMLICTEAGGTVSDLEGEPIRFPDEVSIGRCMVATNGLMHRKVIEYLR